MKCEDMKNLISEYIDGMAENPDEIKQHIDSCEQCRRYFEEIKHTKNLCNSVTMAPLPSDFKDRLNKKLKNIEYIPWYKNRKMYISAAGLAACLVIAVGPVYQTYEDISVDTKKAETMSVSGMPEETNNIAAAPQTAEENEKSAVSQESRTIVYSQNITADEAEITPRSSDSTALTNEIPTLQEDLSAEQISPAAAVEEKHLQTPAYSPEESEDAYNETASEYEETVIKKSDEETTASASEIRSSGGSGGAAADTSSSVEEFSQIYVFPAELKIWFDENIVSPKTIEYDGEEIYIISESDLAKLMAEADTSNTAYSSLYSDLPSGYYVSFSR